MKRMWLLLATMLNSNFEGSDWKSNVISYSRLAALNVGVRLYFFRASHFLARALLYL